jgi:hypothetical protein
MAIDTVLGVHLLVGASRRNADSRRATERVEFLQFWACAAILVALEDFDVIFQLELFEEPDDPLGARLLKPETFGQRMT